MPASFTYPAKLRRGDAVAVLSPSAGLPARFPLPYELGLTRMREEFGLRPVEYPTTRAPQASPAERAADIHAAFADQDIKATYTKEQHEAVLAAVNEYHAGVPLVFGVDFGHTEPQHIIPSGGSVTVDAGTRQIHVTY